MKNIVFRVAALMLVLIMLTSISVFADGMETGSTENTGSNETIETGKVPEVFTCYTYDEHGNVLDGFWDKEDGIWYLFVTSTQAIEDTALYYTGDITEASAGTLDVDAGTVSGAFAVSGDRVELIAEDGSVYTVVMMQSNLPSIHITLEGTSLDKIHEDKDKKHEGNNIYIMDPAGEYDLVVEGSLEIKGRGNTTWRNYEKKAYQIKFDEKTSVLGMGKAKKWVLLANASDDSMMRTQLVYQMAKQMDMDFVCSLEYVDLWIDGEYRGTFLAGDKVEPGSSRLKLENDAGVLFEHDEDYYREEDYWLYSKILDRHFVMKEIMEEDDAIIEAAMADFEAAVDELATYLFSTPSYQVTLEDLSAMIDVDSFIKYYLVNEYALNRESVSTSFYWYKDGPDDVIHLGPLWDFDTCMGNDGEGFDANYGNEHVLFRNLLAAPVFYDRTMVLLQQYRDVLETMTANVDVVYEQIAASAEMNYIRWDVLGKPNNKVGAVDFYPTYAEAVDALRQWLTGRETGFRVPECSIVTGIVSEDCYELELTFKDGNEYTDIMFAVWSDVGGQNDLTWYPAMQEADGSWRFTVDLGDHNSAGMYRMDAYTDGGATVVATGRNYVPTARTSRYHLNVEVSEDCTTMTITMDDAGMCSTMTFGVWSDVDGQDDLRWYDVQRGEDGLWTFTVDMTKHHSAGEYLIHAYGTLPTGRRHLDDTTVYVETAVYGPMISTELSEDCTTMVVTLEHAEDFDRIWIPVWSVNQGQDDLKWYELISMGEGKWTCTVDLSAHGDAGDYQIHVYGGTDSPDTIITDTMVYVPNVPFKRIAVTVSKDCCIMEVVINGASEWEQLWLPVWSEQNAQDDIRWYEADKLADGTWFCAIDLETHGDAGTYYVHAYGGSRSPQQFLGDTTANVSAVPGSLPTVKVTAAMDELTILLKNIGEWENLQIPVWSAAGEQDDLRWYQPVRQADGSWIAVADLMAHGDTGKYHVHVYGGADGAQTQVAATTVTVVKKPGEDAQMRATVADDVLTVELINTGDWSNIWIPVWSDANGQDDIQWYRPERQADGSWLLKADLTVHGTLGSYAIHVYGGEEAPVQMLAYTNIFVDELESAPVIRGSVSADGEQLVLTLSNAQDRDRIWIPVWSAVNGADDQVWYEPVLQADGTWTVTVDLENHSGPGIYHVHVYSGTEAPTTLITYADMTIS